MAGLLTNIYLWVGLSVILFFLFAGLMIFLIVISKKTHAMLEFKAGMKGQPLVLFFQDNRYCDWKHIEPEAGMIKDKQYGSFIVGSTYVDKHTKNVMIPVTSDFGASINVKAAKIADDLKYVFKDQKKLYMMREGIRKGLVDEAEKINVVRTSVNFSSVKHMMNALLPHAISSKIEKVVATKMKGYGGGNAGQAAVIIIALLGALILGGVVVKVMLFSS